MRILITPKPHSAIKYLAGVFPFHLYNIVPILIPCNSQKSASVPRPAFPACHCRPNDARSRCLRPCSRPAYPRCGRWLQTIEYCNWQSLLQSSSITSIRGKHSPDERQLLLLLWLLRLLLLPLRAMLRDVGPALKSTQKYHKDRKCSLHATECMMPHHIDYVL